MAQFDPIPTNDLDIFCIECKEPLFPAATLDSGFTLWFCNNNQCSRHMILVNGGKYYKGASILYGVQESGGKDEDTTQDDQSGGERDTRPHRGSNRKSLAASGSGWQ